MLIRVVSSKKKPSGVMDLLTDFRRHLQRTLVPVPQIQQGLSRKMSRKNSTRYGEKG